jgi:hypothetical protein
MGTRSRRHRRLRVSAAEEIKGGHSLDLVAMLFPPRLPSLRVSAISRQGNGDLLGGNEYPTLAVVDSVSQRLGTESSKHGRMDGSDSGACQESRHGLPCHWKAAISVCRTFVGRRLTIH